MDLDLRRFLSFFLISRNESKRERENVRMSVIYMEMRSKASE